MRPRSLHGREHPLNTHSESLVGACPGRGRPSPRGTGHTCLCLLDPTPGGGRVTAVSKRVVTQRDKGAHGRCGAGTHPHQGHHSLRNPVCPAALGPHGSARAAREPRCRSGSTAT